MLLEFEEIKKLNVDTAKDPGKTGKTEAQIKAAKKKWWEQREQLDGRLKQLVSSIEDLLGIWRVSACRDLR